MQTVMNSTAGCLQGSKVLARLHGVCRVNIAGLVGCCGVKAANTCVQG
jgi:hypothetical protein